MSGPSDKAAETLARRPYSDDEWFALFPRERNELHDEALAELSYDDGYRDAVQNVVEKLRVASWKENGEPRTDGDEYAEYIEREFGLASLQQKED